MHLLKISLILLLSLNLYAGAADGVGTDGPDTYSSEELMGILPNVLDKFVEFMMDEASLKQLSSRNLFKSDEVKAFSFGGASPVIDSERYLQIWGSEYSCLSAILESNDFSKSNLIRYSELPDFIESYLNEDDRSKCENQISRLLEENNKNLEDMIIDSFLAKHAEIDRDEVWSASKFSVALKRGILSHAKALNSRASVIVEYKKNGFCPSPQGDAFLSVRLQDTKYQYAGNEGEVKKVVLCYSLDQLSKLPQRDFEKVILSQFAHELTHLHYSLDESLAERVERRLLERWEKFQIVKAKWLDGFFPAVCEKVLGKFTPKFDYFYYKSYSGIHSFYDDEKQCKQDIGSRNQTRVCLKKDRETNFLTGENIEEKYVLYDIRTKKPLVDFDNLENCREVLFEGGHDENTY